MKGSLVLTRPACHSVSQGLGTHIVKHTCILPCSAESHQVTAKWDKSAMILASLPTSFSALQIVFHSSFEKVILTLRPTASCRPLCFLSHMPTASRTSFLASTCSSLRALVRSFFEWPLESYCWTYSPGSIASALDLKLA